MLGGPLVESTRHSIGLTAPLTAITAAVVGVVANLALFFAGHVLWPQGFEGAFDLPVLLVALGAFLALYRYRMGVVQVILTCGTLGALYSLVV